MPQDKIVIRFQPKGDKALISAIKKLAEAQAKLEGKTKRVRAEFKKMGVSTTLATRNLRNAGTAASGSAGAFSVLRSKLLLASFAFAMAGQVVGRFAKAAGDAEEIINKFNVVF